MRIQCSAALVSRPPEKAMPTFCWRGRDWRIVVMARCEGVGAIPHFRRNSRPGLMGPRMSMPAAAAVSLGLARFSYALLLPPMRAELHWSYFVAGAMNTANAAGYLAGALLAPRWFARHDALRVA